MNTNGFCLLCSSAKISSGKSGQDGRFNFKASIDSSLLKKNHITASVKVPANYILYPKAVGPGIVNNPEYASHLFYAIDPISMSNMSFELYPKTLLKVNLHRTTPISPQKSLSLEFKFDNKTLVWGLHETDSNADTSLTIYTSANIPTKIISRKYFTPTNIISNTDSITCTPNATNSISIDY
ncbi:hypothetical protein [Terrimonas alba]|uniref:hypothetical protein n=1 Tax=Terrimonas alba TaxID=3349636 RepID=UPI0035F466E2